MTEKFGSTGIPKYFCSRIRSEAMTGLNSHDISKFFLIGINYKKSDAAVRGRFAINENQYDNILKLAPSFNIRQIFVLSTCNRTEVYGIAEDAAQLSALLCTQTTGSLETFQSISYTKSGVKAIEHFLQVGAGLDSQILGDYEIVGQIKAAMKFSKQRGFIGAFLERLVNSMLQSSKVVKNQTQLSGGTVSVSFAAVQYIKEKTSSAADKKILVVGIGKIGRNTCRNLVDYLQTTNITLINRTEEKAAALAKELLLGYAPLDELSSNVRNADIIMVATNAAAPTIMKKDLEGMGPKLIIDLSVPSNVEPAALRLPNIQVVNVDELSKLKDKTLQKRKAEVPKAKKIILDHITEFLEWFEMRKNVPVLKAVKLKLQEIDSNPDFLKLIASCQPEYSNLQNKDRIQKIINGMALKMRQQNQKGCQYIQAINEYIGFGAN